MNQTHLFVVCLPGAKAADACPAGPHPQARKNVGTLIWEEAAGDTALGECCGALRGCSAGHARADIIIVARMAVRH